MKKLISAVMVTAMMLCMSGCFLAKGNQYAKEKKKVFEAAEKVCGASELSEDEKADLLERADSVENLSEYDPEALSEGICVELTHDDLESMENASEIKDESSFSEMDLDADQMDNMYAFCKRTDDGAMILTAVLDFKDKKTCEASYKAEEKTLKQTATLVQVAGAKQGGVKANSEKGDKDYSFVVLQEETNELMAVYIQYAGDTITMATYTGTPDSDLFEEFCDFNDEAGFGAIAEMVEDL